MGEEGERRMANYGRQELSPIELDGQWKQIVTRDARRQKNHLATKGGTPHWPGVRPPDTNISTSYYNEKKQRTPWMRGYDAMFRIKHEYNSRLHRDDREHTVGLNVHSEEQNRAVAVLSSSSYGRRVNKPFEDQSSLRKYVRIEHTIKGFHRSRGTGIPTSIDAAGGAH